jgi:hypothetical protein
MCLPDMVSDALSSSALHLAARSSSQRKLNIVNMCRNVSSAAEELLLAGVSIIGDEHKWVMVDKAGRS